MSGSIKRRMCLSKGGLHSSWKKRKQPSALLLDPGGWQEMGGGGSGVCTSGVCVHGQGERRGGVSTAARAVLCIPLPATDSPCVPSPAPAPSCIPPPRLPRAQNQTQVQHGCSLCSSSCSSPPSLGAAANPEFISMQSALIWDTAEGELTSECKQTNTPTTKQRSRDAVDPDRSSSERSQFSGGLTWIPLRSCFGAGCAQTQQPHLSSEQLGLMRWGLIKGRGLQ